jgi:predicted Zn-dependent protease/energy-coupling factor transporter ATP-binding protein EcfA2
MTSDTFRFNPFPGLRPFDFGEQHLFFGREGQSEKILNRLRENGFLAIVGTSGSGKSSLIRAGLLPDLYGGFMTAAGSHWRVAIFRPGGDPMGNLARALNKPDVLQTETPAGGDQERSDTLLEVTLRRSGLGLIEATRLARLGQHENLLVIVDQFEELFRFAGAANSHAQADDAAAFVKLLLEAGRQSDVPIYVVIAMRSDFIGDCARFPDLPETVTAGMYLVPRMTRQQRRQAIEGPVAVGGGTISLRLVNRLLNEVGDNPDQLPILQHALMRTWEHWSAHERGDEPIDFGDYDAIGGLEHALSNHADEAYDALPDDRHREIAKRMFQCLTEKGLDNREIRRPTSVKRIADVAHASTSEVIRVIEEFHKQGRSFLNTPDKGDLAAESLIDISHESLIRLWSRLKIWVNEESESAQMYRRLADSAERHARAEEGLWHAPELDNALAWRTRGAPSPEWAQRYAGAFDSVMGFLDESRNARAAEEAETQRRRNEELHRTRRHLLVVSVFSAVAVALGAYGWIEKRIADRNAVEAKTQEAIARTQEAMARRSEEKLRFGGLRERKLEWETIGDEEYLLDELITLLPREQTTKWRHWKAGLLIREERLDEAQIEADALVQEAPESESARTTRGYIYFLNNKPDNALKEFQYIQARISARSPLNLLNLAITLASLGRYDEARQSLETAIREVQGADTTGGSEELIPPEITQATGRVELDATGDVFLAGLYYLKGNLESYAGGRDFIARFEDADREALNLKLREMDKEDACLVALTWAWLHQRARPQDYGLLATEGALWERAGYPDYAARRYAAFQAAHARHADGRYVDLAGWVKNRSNEIDPSGSYARSALPAMNTSEMEVESQILVSKKRLAEAETLIDDAIKKEPSNTRLYLRRVEIHYAMATKADAEREELENKIHDLNESRTRFATASPNAKGSGTSTEQQPNTAESAQLKNLQEQADAKKTEAMKYYDSVVQDCNIVLEGRSGVADAYFDRAYAKYNLQGRPEPPLRATNTILEDLRRGLLLKPDSDFMLALSNFLTGRDMSKLSENDPRLDEALRVREKYARVSPADSENLARLAALQQKKNRFADSLRSIERAIAVDGSDPGYYETRAEAEKALGLDLVQVQQRQAEGYRRAGDLLSSRGKPTAGYAYEQSWKQMREVAKAENNEDMHCDSAVRTCAVTKVLAVSSEWIVSRIDSVMTGAGDTRDVRIDRGREDGIVSGSRGNLYAAYSKEGKHERPVGQIGTGEVLFVEPRSALVRVTMKSPSGDGRVRQNDGFMLKALVADGAERSVLWTVAKDHIVLLNLEGERILDYAKLHGRADAELDEQLFKTMLDDIHEVEFKDEKMRDAVVTAGSFHGKTLREALAGATRADLERFLKYVARYPGDYFGRDWKIAVIYALWVREGAPDE